MKHIAFATSLICCLLTYHEATAQGFWSVPPGADLSFRDGIDLGNGLGFGYGFGVGYGSFEWPAAAVSGAAVDLQRFQNQSDVMTPQATDDGADDYAARIKDLQQVTAEFRAKQRALKLYGPKTDKESIVQPSAVQGTRRSSGSQSRLSCSQFDRSTGKVVWPEVLLRDSFFAERTEIDSLLESLAQTSITTDLSVKIARKTHDLHEELRKQIRAIPTKDFLEGHHFLERLALEGRLGWPSSDSRLCV